jgi:parvulin-like peptidyl-prolyl isomerase
MIVAKVNNYDIKKVEYLAELHNTKLRMKLDEANAEAKKNAINQLIDGYLLLEKAKDIIATIPDAEIDERFVEVSMKFSNKETFEDAMAAQNLTEDLLCEQIKNELTIKKYIAEKFSDLPQIEESKLQEIYQQNTESFQLQESVKASHILIKNDQENPQEKAAEIKARIKTPQQFTAEAKNCSDCPSCCNFGDLGYIERGKMVKEFEDVAFALQVGEISQPVKTPFGYHIIMLTDKRPSRLAAFEEVKDTLLQRVQQIEKELNIMRHIKELRAKAEVEIFEDRL